MTMLHLVALGELWLCWIVWSISFLKPRREAAHEQKAVRNTTSRWGLFLVMCGFGCVWAYAGPFQLVKAAPWLIASMVLAPLSVALAWTATRHLGKQWRFEAALNEQHELVQTGPYRWLRHPIYTSMGGMLLATGLAWSWWPLVPAGVALFIVGTEIRVRAEESLLAERFQDAFVRYKASTRAYIPIIR